MLLSPKGTLIDPAHALRPMVRTHHRGGSWDREYTLSEKEAFLAKNAEVLKRARDAFAYPIMSPPVRSAHDVPASLRNASSLLYLADVFVLDGQVKAAHGDWRGACNAGLDIIQLGLSMARGGVLLDATVGAAVEAKGRPQVCNSLDHLSAEEAAAAARRLEALCKTRVPYGDSLREDKWQSQALMLEALRSPYGRSFAVPSDGSRYAKLLARARLRFETKRHALGEFTRYMDGVIAAESHPYALCTPLPALPRDAFNKGYHDLPRSAEVYREGRLVDSTQQARDALLLTALALRAYRMEHGSYPAKLADLVPGHLRRVPDDVFGKTGPLRYKRAGDRYLLYSVGPDGKDNGGAPITGHPARGSKGDIVFGTENR
jgi:hypothetical protein